jgi:hypothetical protein
VIVRLGVVDCHVNEPNYGKRAAARPRRSPTNFGGAHPGRLTNHHPRSLQAREGPGVVPLVGR